MVLSNLNGKKMLIAKATFKFGEKIDFMNLCQKTGGRDPLSIMRLSASLLHVFFSQLSLSG